MIFLRILSRRWWFRSFEDAEEVVGRSKMFRNLENADIPFYISDPNQSAKHGISAISKSLIANMAEPFGGQDGADSVFG